MTTLNELIRNNATHEELLAFIETLPFEIKYFDPDDEICGVCWSIGDILSNAEADDVEIDDNDAKEILRLLADSCLTDADENGWNLISSITEDYLESKASKLKGKE